MRRIALLLVLCLCFPPAALAGRADASVIVVMDPTSEPAAGFDPAYGWGAGEHTHEPLIQSTLTVTTPELGIGYDLATDMSTSPDGLTWTATLREDARFTDGEPLTAEDVAFTYNTLKTSSTVNDFTMFENAEAVDEFTVRFTLNQPFSVWPYTMATVGILPAHAYGPDYGQHPIGSGRYMLAQWDKGQQVILTANPDYYGEAPRMQKVTVLFLAEDAAYMAALANAADVITTAPGYAAQEMMGYSLLRCESVDNRGLSLPTLPFGGERGNDVTSDGSLRYALQLGIDREALVQNVLDGYGTPAYSVCDKLPWFNTETAVPQDLPQALSTLEDAGWLPGADDIRVKDGLRASFPLLYPAGDSVRQALAAELSNQCKALGIEALPEGVGWDTAYDRAQREPLLWGWGAHTPMELYHLYHTLPETGSAPYVPYANEAVNAALDAALAADSLEESYTLWQQAQWDGDTGTGTAVDLPFLWLCNIDHLYFVREGLTVAEQKIHPHGHGWSIVNNVEQWEWEQ